MRTLPEIVTLLEDRQKSALATLRHSPSYEECADVVSEINVIRDVLGLPEWDEKTETVVIE